MGSYCAYVYEYVCIYIYIYVFAHMYVYNMFVICVYAHVCLCIWLCIIYLHICTYDTTPYIIVKKYTHVENYFILLRGPEKKHISNIFFSNAELH